MRFSTALLFGAVAVQAAPTLVSRADPCFVIGNTPLPQEVIDTDNAIASQITCNPTKTTIAKVPDVTAGSTSFSSIDFSKSSLTPLGFALKQFATDPTSLAATNLTQFQNSLAVYEATEAGLRSVDGSLAIKVPKFFLSFQVSRIQTAQGNPPTAAGQQVDHLLQKVLKNAPTESQALKDQVTALSKQLS
ncbi:hypothetical protein TD95_005227 [Thielaviopsis punctulata]|uniref:DUF7143 domain-containing protein n=1 Tax=Thielaviopsis punctulata TaxID=72032 RepID=A0A0F4ZJB9_9PEZI|nr:hypothetical protein TD95_005227 [Thielaviopsis punctulata]